MHLPLDLQEHILGHPIPYFPRNPHQLLWPGPTGHCTVKQATKFLFICEGVESNAAYWNWIWIIACPPNIRIFIWKCFFNRLPTRSFLSCIILGFPNSCPWCLSPKTTLHIIRDCPWAKEFWLSLPKTRSLFFSLDLQAWVVVNLTKQKLSNPSSILWPFIFAQGIWQLWLAQNKRIFAPPMKF